MVNGIKLPARSFLITGDAPELKRTTDTVAATLFLDNVELIPLPAKSRWLPGHSNASAPLGPPSGDGSARSGSLKPLARRPFERYRIRVEGRRTR